MTASRSTALRLQPRQRPISGVVIIREKTGRERRCARAAGIIGTIRQLHDYTVKLAVVPTAPV